MEFRTERLILRPPEDGDRAAVQEIFGQKQVVAHRPDPRPETAEEATIRLQRDIEHWQAHGFGRWALEMKEGVVGFGGLTYRAGFTGLNLSYHLHAAVWGQGLASEFAQAAAVIAFRDLAAKRVIGLVRPINLASRRVLEKAGLKLEGDFPYGGHPGLLYARLKL
jgi:RimJ/RimL family protein N-acetyltransferase